jgi:hypothetical protein
MKKAILSYAIVQFCAGTTSNAHQRILSLIEKRIISTPSVEHANKKGQGETKSIPWPES